MEKKNLVAKAFSCAFEPGDKQIKAIFCQKVGLTLPWTNRLVTPCYKNFFTIPSLLGSTTVIDHAIGRLSQHIYAFMFQCLLAQWGELFYTLRYLMYITKWGEIMCHWLYSQNSFVILSSFYEVNFFSKTELYLLRSKWLGLVALTKYITFVRHCKWWNCTNNFSAFRRRS